MTNQTQARRIVPIDTIDLSDAAEKIRPTNAALADLLAAVADVDEDSLHSVLVWSNDERECTEDCTPCTAKYAAQVVAARYLRTLAKRYAARRATKEQ